MMLTYSEWCRDLERQYERMPQWYWNHSKSRRNYELYVQHYEEMYDNQDTND